jgi:hypothetical protein
MPRMPRLVAQQIGAVISLRGPHGSKPMSE